MKNIILFVIALGFLAACKKDRTCNCTITQDGGTPTHSSFVMKHVTKKDAQGHLCVDITKTVVDSTGTHTTVIDCTLAK